VPASVVEAPAIEAVVADAPIAAIVETPAPVANDVGLAPVFDDDDEIELLRRLPNAQVEHFDEAGHSLQGYTPVELAQSIEKFVYG